MRKANCLAVVVPLRHLGVDVTDEHREAATSVEKRNSSRSLFPAMAGICPSQSLGLLPCALTAFMARDDLGASRDCPWRE